MDDSVLAVGEEILNDLIGDETIEASVIKWCEKYAVLFHAIFEDEDLRHFFKNYDVYQPYQGHHGLYDILDVCMHEAYNSNVVITSYSRSFILSFLLFFIDNITHFDIIKMYIYICWEVYL